MFSSISCLQSCCLYLKILEIWELWKVNWIYKKHFKWGRLYAYNLNLALLSLMAAHNFSLHYCQLMTLLMTWDLLFITLFCHTKLQTETYLVFDRYYKYSIKGLKRDQRTVSIASDHVLSLSTSIPQIEDTMLSTGNKV